MNAPHARVPIGDADGTPVLVAREWLNFLTNANAETSTSATAGAASALPATPAGYLTISINGRQFKLPYYA